jgi:hypothetical protein
MSLETPEKPQKRSPEQAGSIRVLTVVNWLGALLCWRDEFWKHSVEGRIRNHLCQPGHLHGAALPHKLGDCVTLLLYG